MEELQSLNEGLVTADAHLQARTADPEAAADDLGSLLASTDIAVLFLDPRFRIRRYTPATRDLFDLIPDDVGRPLTDLRRKFTDPDLAADARAVLDRPVPVEREVTGDSGRTYLRRVLPYRTQDNRTGGVAVAFVDVTALRAGEGRLRLALTAARMGVWTLDTAAGAHHRDANMNRLLGLDAVEATQPFAEFLAHVHPADRGRVQAAFDRSAREGLPLNVEFRVVRPDGAVRWLRDQGDVFGDAAAGRRVMAGACVDVTERREAENAARAGEERLRLILASATDYAILTLDADRVVTSWSPGAAVTFGYAEGEIVGRSADVLFTPEDLAAGAPEREAATARRDGRAADERWQVRKDGTRFYASGVLTPKAAGGFVKVAHDLSGRKRMEDELRAARDRLEERVAERTAELTGAVEALEAEMDRRRAIAQRLSTAQEDERKRVSRDLHDAVGQTHAALALALRAAAAAVPPGGEAADRQAYAAGLAETMGRELHEAAVRLRPTILDDIGLAPAVAELVTQWSARAGVAAEYQSTGLDTGRLPAGVETALYRVVQEALTNVARHARARAVSVTVGRAGGEARAVVEDDGVGFDPDAGTTRLGLAGMRERVELLGGALEVESASGAGTTVIARVPLAGPAPPAP